jgi:MoaA/NifB/PqqE/SkfB family radical SAM enzyme
MPHRLKGVCADCLMREQCLGTCLAQNYYRDGDLWGPFWFCDKAEKSGMFPGTRLSLGLPREGIKEAT